MDPGWQTSELNFFPEAGPRLRGTREFGEASPPQMGEAYTGSHVIISAIL